MNIFSFYFQKKKNKDKNRHVQIYKKKKEIMLKTLISNTNAKFFTLFSNFLL